MTLTSFWVILRRFICSNFQRKHKKIVDPKQTVVADDLSHLEYGQSINSRTINVHMKNKTLAKCLCRYVKATSDYPKAMQTYDSTLPSGTITTVHASHREYKCNQALVTDVFEVEKPVYVDETARQQEIASR